MHAKIYPEQFKKKDTVSGLEISHEKKDPIVVDYVHYIRNIKRLSPEMMESISSLSSNDKMLIIHTLNDVVDSLSILVNECIAYVPKNESVGNMPTYNEVHSEKPTEEPLIRNDKF